MYLYVLCVWVCMSSTRPLSVQVYVEYSLCALTLVGYQHTCTYEHGSQATGVAKSVAFLEPNA